jgi:hypothetical protein
MKKLFIIIIIILFSYQICSGGKYRAEGWMYGSAAEVGWLPPNTLYGSVLKVAIGLDKIGVGAALMEGYRPNESDSIINILPFYLYYTPFLFDTTQATGGIYSYLSVSSFGKAHIGENSFPSFSMRFGIGVNYDFFGFEPGISWIKYSNISQLRFYVSFTVISAFLPIGEIKRIEKKPPPIEKLIVEKPKYPPFEKSIVKKPPVVKPKYPPDLITSDIKFSEPSGNDVLDGYEKGRIYFRIKNKGKGEAINVKVKVIPLTSLTGIKYNREIQIGNISPNSWEDVNIEIEAEPEVKEGTVNFRVEISEEYGFDAEPFSIAFKVKPFKPPQFTIADYGIDDDKEGDSYGDNDGIIELGEAIEMTVGIQNIGIGDASEVKAKVEITGENVYYDSEKNIFDLGEIKSGSYKSIKFFFTLSKRYDKDFIPIKISISESKGRYGKDTLLNLPINRPTGKGKEIVITEKPVKPSTPLPKEKKIIDVDTIPKNSLTRLEDGICVIFGIENYRYAPKASFANRDAVIFYEYAKKVFGIPERNIYIRTNEEATKGEFDKVFSKEGWLKKRVSKSSDVIIYFSGHGVTDIKSGERYLLPYDIDPIYANSGVAIKEILNFLSTLNAKSVIIFIDACFSGIGREGELLLAETKPIILPKIEKVPEDISILASASGSEISLSYSQMEHGLFTYYLLKGLSEADLNKDKTIMLKELADYVKEKVMSKAREFDKEQTPEFSGKDKVLLKLK